jgi:hypothetical protein
VTSPPLRCCTCVTPLCVYFSATAVKRGVDFGMQVRQYLEPGAGAAVPFKSDEHEAVYKYFINRVLKVCPSTPDLVIYGEVTRLSSAFFRQQMIINYWNRLCVLANDRLLEKKLSGKCCTGVATEAMLVSVTTVCFDTFLVCYTKDPQPFDTDFVAELGRIEREYYNIFGDKNKTNSRRIQQNQNYRFCDATISPGYEQRNQKMQSSKIGLKLYYKR